MTRAAIESAAAALRAHLAANPGQTIHAAAVALGADTDPAMRNAGRIVGSQVIAFTDRAVIVCEPWCGSRQPYRGVVYRLSDASLVGASGGCKSPGRAIEAARKIAPNA